MSPFGRIFLAVFALTASALAWAAQYYQCTEYVADQYGIMHYGNAKTWYDDSRFLNTGYTQYSSPAVGAIIVFDGWSKNTRGHVGIVREIVSSTEIKIDHANWHNDEVLLTGVGVKQASGSWSSVKVKYSPGDENYGASSYAVRGFLYPPSSSYSVIGANSPYFKEKCIDQYPWDNRCVTADIDPWLECRDTNPPGGRSPICEYGGGGGDYETSLPDFILNKAWLVDDAGKLRAEFHPGQHLQMKGQIKNVGPGNSPAAITVKFYLSNGVNIDSNKQRVGSDTVQASSLPSDGTHTETEGLYAPTTLGTYNIQVCADPSNAVSEEQESNNCSKAVVFKVVYRTKEERKKFLRTLDQIIND